MSDTKAKTVEIDTDKRIEEMLKQLMEMIKKGQEELITRYKEMMTEITKSYEEMTAELKKNNLKDMRSSREAMNSQETMKTELKTEVEMKVQVIEDKVHIVEETATSPKSEVKEDVQRIESKAENKREELQMENEGTDVAKPTSTTDSNEDATTDNAEQKPEFNDNAKEGESSGSVAANSSNDVPENEEKTTNLQVAWEVPEFDKKIYQKRGEEGGNFESAVSDIKEGLGVRDEIAASTVEEQQGQDETRNLQRPQEGPYSIVTEMNYDGWRIPKRPRVKMKFVRLKLFEGSTDGVT